ncbi:hypothetical protein EV682_103400 [Iodobacter fluviatilis]|uniref:Uncharacterized protein n=1 Tax=Iodobacter fluviatilis TaxID=537 RepID=A0A377Q8B0_9NEIS|nr:hypothetical protein EV682_103400 [Iodobacter fluviatilis]STQ91112.1 Uncharacterised protein [Iodobacter fluviatilis]
MGGTDKKAEDGKSGDQAAAPPGSKLYDAGPSGITPTAPVALSAGDNGSSTNKSAIASANDEAKQKELTGKVAAETIASLSRDTDGAQQQLANDFKPEKINELFSATKTFLQEGNTFMANRTAEADAEKRHWQKTQIQMQKCKTVRSGDRVRRSCGCCPMKPRRGHGRRSNRFRCSDSLR